MNQFSYKKVQCGSEEGQHHASFIPDLDHTFATWEVKISIGEGAGSKQLFGQSTEVTVNWSSMNSPAEKINKKEKQLQPA